MSRPSGYITLFRQAHGRAVDALADDASRPEVTPDPRNGLAVVFATELEDLVTARAPFDPVCVSVDDVRAVLGWDV